MSEPASRHRWLPTLTDLVFIILLIAFSFGSLAPRLLWDADIGWHIRNGQNILTTHHVPEVDSFSATMSGHRWYAWEWLYDALIGWMYNHAGLNGVVFVSALAIAATLALVFRITLRRGTSLPITVVLFVFCAMAASIHFLARPHVVGWLLAVVWFWIVDTSKDEIAPTRLLWLPCLMLLWANLHGGFVLGFVLLGIYILGDCLMLLRCRVPEQRRAARGRVGILVAAAVFSFLASLVNPYGIKLHIHVYHYLTDRFLMQHINEFRRPDLHGAPAQAFLVMVALTILAIVAARGRMRWTNWLLIIFSVASGLYAARNLPFAAMLLMMIAGPPLSRAVEQKMPFLAPLQRWRGRELSMPMSGWPLAAIALCTILCFNQGRMFGRQIMDAHFDSSRLPVQAAEVLQQREIRDPIFTLDSWGGYFIYQLYPDNKVFVDDRHDFYGDDFIRRYLKVIHAEPDWTEILDGMGVNLIIMPSKSKLTDILTQSPRWQIISKDSTAVVFERR